MSFLQKSFIPALVYIIWTGLILFFNQQELWFYGLTLIISMAVTLCLVKLFPSIKGKSS